MSTATTQWGRAARVSWIVFIVGGIAILFDAAVQGVAAVSSVTVADWVNTVLGLGGLWVATFGLVCVYPHLADDGRWPRGALLAGLGAWVLLTGAIGWTVVRTLTGATGEASGTTLLVLPALVLALLSFLFYGVSSTRTGQPSRTVGYLFLVPFGAVLLLILSFFGTQIADTEFPVVVGVVLFGVLAASIIGLGATLPRDSGGDRSQPG